MAYYAYLDENNVVTFVISGKNEGEDGVDWEQYYGNGQKCKRTSYNTRGGVHYGPDGQPDGGVAFRKNSAGIGYTYDEQRDAFIPPKPYPSWILDEQTCWWNPPIPSPTDGRYQWDEDSQSWILISEVP